MSADAGHRPDEPEWYRTEKCPRCGAGIVWDWMATVPHYRCKACAWRESSFDGARNPL